MMRIHHRATLFLVALAACLAVGTLAAQEPFSKIVGDVRVGPVKPSDTLEVPFITWGGDVATFYANGGLSTRPDSLFARQGLNLNLVPGDDFPEQVRRYLRGDTPFLRGTMRMLGQASEVIGTNPATRPVVFLQLTWSRGDHMVGRADIKSLDDLKPKDGKKVKIALQRGGPHVGMLDDVLDSVQMTWNDIDVEWTDDLTGDDGPAARFAKDSTIDCCMAISPDMAALTGGLESTGTGAEGTVRGAHVVISTATMTRSIADVYACRKDYYDENRATVEKFVAGYLKACEELLVHKKTYEEKGKAAAPEYWATLEMTQKIYGPDVIPTLEIDAHGLISDCALVGLPGNYSFFMDPGNTNGFKPKQDRALKLAVGQGYASIEAGFYAPGLDYARIKTIGDLSAEVITSGAEIGGDFNIDDIEAKDTILSFTINFQPNQFEFDPKVYGPDFLRAIRSASTFGNAIVVIRGHSDPTKTLGDMIKAGMAKGVIKRTGSRGDRKYFVNGKPLDIASTKDVVKLIETGAFDGVTPNPRETMQAALNLSRLRAERVREAIAAYAEQAELRLDETQIQPQGVGVTEPLNPKPGSFKEALENMRVEFRLVRKTGEVESGSDFDF